jgi:hypothetical protein
VDGGGSGTETGGGALRPCRPWGNTGDEATVRVFTPSFMHCTIELVCGLFVVLGDLRVNVCVASCSLVAAFCCLLAADNSLELLRLEPGSFI